MNEQFFNDQLEEAVNRILSDESESSNNSNRLMNLFSTILNPGSLQINTSIVRSSVSDIPYASPFSPLTPASPSSVTPGSLSSPSGPSRSQSPLSSSLRLTVGSTSVSGLSSRRRTERIVDPYRRFSSLEYRHAKDEFRELCETDFAREASPPTRLLNILIDFYYDNDEEWPTQEEILEHVKAMPCGCIFLSPTDTRGRSEATDNVSVATEQGAAELESCFQLSYYSEDDIDDMLYHYLFSEARIPSCQEIFPILEYYSTMNRYPNPEELQTYAINRLAFYLNPEEYHQQDKEHVPVLHPERIPLSVHYGDPVGCGICQDDISEGQKKIVLKKCKHVFHAESVECLETASIFNWFKTESKCPMCKSDVKEDPVTP